MTMIRLVSKRILCQNGIISRAFSSAVAEASVAGPPSVMDSIVRLNVVDPSGARRTIPAYIGKCFAVVVSCCTVRNSNY
jgi:hypothetical protein